MRWGMQSLVDFRELLAEALLARGIRTGRYAIENVADSDYILVTVIHDDECFVEHIDAAELVIDRQAVEAKILEFVDRIAGRDPRSVAFLPEGVE